MKSLAAPDSMFDMRESALPRRRSVRAIFEPLHRTEVDLRETSLLGSDAAKHQLWSKISQNNQSSSSASAMKSKRLCKFGLINCKKSDNSKGKDSTTRLNTPSSAFNNKPGSRRGSKTGSGTRKRQSKSLKTASSAMTGDGKEDRNVMEGDVSIDNSNTTGSGPALLSQLEDMRSKLHDRLAKDLKDKLAEKKADVHLNDVMKMELGPLDQSFLPSTKYKQPWKSTKLGGHSGSSPSMSSKKSKRNKRSRRTIPNEREKQFRALYDRIRAHYLIQEEMYKTMAPKEKLEKAIANTIHFEKELLEYLSLPNADPQAMLVLKELRSRRATMVTKLAALPQSERPGTSIVKDPIVKKPLQKKGPKNPKRSSQKLKPKSSSNAAQIAPRQSVKSKRAVMNNNSKNIMIPQSLRPHTSSKRFSRRSIFKLFNDKSPLSVQKNGEADSQYSGQAEENNGGNDGSTKKQNEMGTWRKSDFIKLLPHAGEIPKYVSKVEAVESRATSRTHRDPKAYMRWLEDLMAQQIDSKQQRATSPTEMEPKKISRIPPPRWTQIITRKGKEDPFAPYFKASLVDEQASKQTPLLSRPQPNKDSKRQSAMSKANSKSLTTTTTPKLGTDSNHEGMNAIEKAIWDVVAHQTKYMEETTLNLPQTNPPIPITLPSVNEKSYHRTLFPNVINARVHEGPELAVDTILKGNEDMVTTGPTSSLIGPITSDSRLADTDALELSPPPPIRSTRPIDKKGREGVTFSPETSLRINNQHNTSAMPRVMAPVVKPPRYLREQPKRDGRVGPLTSNNIYSNPKSILKSILPASTGLRPRAPTRSRYYNPLPPGPSPVHAISPRFLDQFLNRNETKRLMMASGQQDAERILIAT